MFRNLILFLGIFSLSYAMTDSKNSKSVNIDDFQKNNNQTIQKPDYFSNKVMVVAHRGDWRNAPENSLQAIQNCIEMGVDMVEIDLKRTKDGQIILMHDKTLNRTSTGIGLVKDVVFDSISKFSLRNGYGMATHHKIPILKEVLELCKNKILVFLDKGYSYIPEVMIIIKKLEMEEQVFFEGKATFKNLQSNCGSYFDAVNYMPRVKIGFDNDGYLLPYLQLNKKSIFIISSDKKGISEMQKNIKKIKSPKRKIMLTTLWNSTCGGYTDDLALLNPDENWGKVIDLGADLICTDRPFQLLEYLREKKLHN